MGNMISWNWPNWITVVLMVAIGYLAVSLLAQLAKARLGRSAGPTTGSGGGQSQSQKNFAGFGNFNGGVFGSSPLALGPGGQ